VGLVISNENCGQVRNALDLQERSESWAHGITAVRTNDLRDIILEALDYAYWCRLGNVEECPACRKHPTGICEDIRKRGAGNNGPVSTARASSFLNAAGTMGR
jgi:hypothetical protein